MSHAGKFKLAVVGISSDSAKEFLPEVFYSHATKLVAVCDEDNAALKKVCASYMINGYHTYEDLVANEDFDFAVITSPKLMQRQTKVADKATPETSLVA